MREAKQSLGQSGFSFLKSLLTRASSGEVGGQGHEWVLGKQSWTCGRAIVGARHWVSKRNTVQSMDCSGFSALPQPTFSF